MKKILSIVAVLVMLFALTVPALAAVSSPFAQTEVTIVPGEEKVTVNIDGADVECTIVISDAVVTAEQAAALTIADGSKVEFADISLRDSEGNEVQLISGTVKVAMIYPAGKDKDVIVKAWNDSTKAWDVVKSTVDADGNIIAEFTHFCTVAFEFSEKKAVTPGGAPGGKPAGGPEAPKAPQTGYNTGLWALAAVAMALCAGYCFVARRKVAE